MNSAHRFPHRRVSSLCAAVTILFFAAPLRAEQTLSVLYFQSLDGSAEYLWMEKGIADTLISELSGVEGVLLVERERLQELLEEQRLEMSGLTDESTAVEVGNLLNAELILMGSYAVSGNALLVNCRLVRTKTGSVGAGFSEQGPVDQFLAIQRKLAARICAGLGLRKEDPAVEGAAPSFQALSFYYEGLDLYDRGQYAEAASLMRKSLESAPGFAKPSLALEDCYRFLQDFRAARRQRELNQLLRELEQLLARLDRSPFVTYAELMARAAAAGEDLQKLAERLKDDVSWFRGDTPAQVLWNAQLVLFQIGQKLAGDFSDPEGAESQYRRMIQAAQAARTRFPEEPFLPELLYQEILALYMLRDWASLEKACAAFMSEWPDFRMITSVEDFFEKSLENRD
jgi:TolB-like protein